MSRRKKIDMEALADEMGAVSSFARENIAMTQTDVERGGQQGLIGSLLLSPLTSPMHDRRTLANGELDVAVGWDIEPAIEGQRNAALIRVMRANVNPTQPIDGVDSTLSVRVHQGEDTREFSLRAVHGRRGDFVADFIPTRAGDYRFAFVGTIEGHPIDAVFDSADGAFTSVRPAVDMGFPVPIAGTTETIILSRETRSTDKSARALAVAGVGIGVVGLLVAVAAYRAGLRLKPAPAGPRQVAPGDLEQENQVQAEDGRARSC
jgi:hypothetical protein